MYRSFAQEVKEDYSTAHEKLRAVFHNQEYLGNFRDSLTARPGLASESIDVYVVDLTNPVMQAFPIYSAGQHTVEILCRFFASVDPLLRGRCKETDVDNLAAATELCKNVERAQVDYRAAHKLQPQLFSEPVDQSSKTVANIQGSSSLRYRQIS